MIDEAGEAARAAGQLVEVVTADGTVVDVITRAQLRQTGARHRCTYVVVVRSSGHVVVHQRAAWKDVSPSAWDLAFGGLCDVGEGWLQAARRELAEEAGITDVPLIDLGDVAWEGNGTALVGRVFVAVSDGPVRPADGEVVAVDEVPLVDLGRWMAGRLMVDDTPEVVPPLLRRWAASTG
ncbi:MAG TPA: NUDIX domain-containing protein [Euzebya sp.]|nr:NUDIX domain-containing protein [Euzebya sp.]